jgi:hypothetical protein
MIPIKQLYRQLRPRAARPGPGRSALRSCDSRNTATATTSPRPFWASARAVHCPWLLGTMKTGIRRGVGLFAVAAACACESQTGTASPTPSPSSNLGAEYLRLVAPTNAAADKLVAADTAPSPDLNTIKAAAQELITADAEFNSGLLRMEARAPSSLRPDFEAARHAESQEVADLQEVTSAPSLGAANTALSGFGSHRTLSGATFVQLRSDLGLPPPPGL